MAIRLRHPRSQDGLQALLEANRSAALTYEPAGLCANRVVPRGFRLDEWSTQLGNGPRVFDAARSALQHWRVHRDAGLLVLADGPPTAGSTVAMCAPLPIGYVDVVCRIIDVVDDPDRTGFTYGTLPTHPEKGEESFLVTQNHGGDVWFEGASISRPHHALARAFSPIARILQRRATERYLTAMRATVST